MSSFTTRSSFSGTLSAANVTFDGSGAGPNVATVQEALDAVATVADAAAAGELLIPMACNAGAAVGDLVVPDTSVDNTVQSISSNVYTGLVLGVVHDKPTPTTCRVQVSGSIVDPSLTLTRATVFVGTDGRPTTTPPATGHLQIIGRGFAATRYVVDVAQSKVVQ